MNYRINKLQKYKILSKLSDMRNSLRNFVRRQKYQINDEWTRNLSVNTTFQLYLSHETNYRNTMERRIYKAFTIKEWMHSDENKVSEYLLPTKDITQISMKEYKKFYSHSQIYLYSLFHYLLSDLVIIVSSYYFNEKQLF